MSEELAIEPVDVVTEAPAEVAETPEPSKVENNDEPAPDAETQDKPEPTEAEKVRYAMQKRIDRQTARNAQMERELAELREKSAKIEQPKQDDGPKEADFETVEDYLIAKGKWEAKQEFAAEQKTKADQETQAKQMQILNERRKEFEKKEAEFRASKPDYDEAVAVVNEYVAAADKATPGFGVFRDIMMECNDLAAMSYHLGKNPDIIEGLQNARPVEVARTLFRLEQELENAPKVKTQPKAAPLKPVGGSPVQKTDEVLSGKDLLKKYRKN